MIWRVRGRAEFAALSRARRHTRGPLSVRVVCGEGDEPPRVAYAIGRSVGPAVVRNRVRRRLRAAARASADLLHHGCAYMVAVAPAAAELSYEQLHHTLRACLDTLRATPPAASPVTSLP